MVYVTERCDPHPEVGWKAALLGGAVGALCAALVVWRFGGWGAPDYLWMLIGLQVGVVIGWVASRFGAVARSLIDNEALDGRVEGRAAEAFLEEQVFATRDRTGVLVFVALFEHRVLVLADEGINTRVDDDAWKEISEEVASGLRRGKPASALIHAVGRCADLLVEHGGIPPWTRRMSCPTNRGSAVTRFPLAFAALLLSSASMTALALDVPSLEGRVNDYADLISPAAETRIEQMLAALERDEGAQGRRAHHRRPRGRAARRVQSSYRRNVETWPRSTRRRCAPVHREETIGRCASRWATAWSPCSAT